MVDAGRLMQLGMRHLIEPGTDAMSWPTCRTRIRLAGCLSPVACCLFLFLRENWPHPTFFCIVIAFSDQ